MKKNKGKKKFVDLDIKSASFSNYYQSTQNDDTLNKKKSNNYNNSNDTNIPIKLKKTQNFKSSLEKLIFYFPNFSSDFIKEMYEENNNNYSKTKNLLYQLTETEKNDSESITQEPQPDINKTNNKNSKYNEIIDITNLAKFEISDKIDDNDNHSSKNFENKNESYNNKNESNNDILINKNKKNKKFNEYSSIFLISTDNNNFTTQPNNNSEFINDNKEITVDDYLFDQYINFLNELFPFHTREEIIKQICENNFDIDAVVLNFLKKDSNYNINNNTENDDYENFQITNKDEILCNFLSFDNGKQNNIDINLMNENLVQDEIESAIKKENLKKQNIKEKDNEEYNEMNDYYNNKDDNNDNNADDDGFFVYKNIDELNSKKIRDDLKKLIKNFPLIDEFTIKWIYYQYMDYGASYQFLNKNYEKKNSGLTALLNSLNNKTNFCYTNGKRNNQTSKSNNSNHNYNTKNNNFNHYAQNENENKTFEIFKKIIDKKPINWKFEEDKDNINLNDYIAVRKKLIVEARNACANKNYQNAQIIMAKAKRYKQEIDKIYTNQRLKCVLKKNLNGNEIDLHGLTLDESKYIIEKKISTLKNKKEENYLKSITLNIITGTGSHSIGHKPVLLPKLTEWLKAKTKLKVEVDNNQGIIFVTLF